MDARAALRKKFRDWRVCGCCLKQLNPRFADRQHRHTHLLICNLFNVSHLEPKRVAIETRGIFDSVRGDANMIDLHLSNSSTAEYGSRSLPATSAESCSSFAAVESPLNFSATKRSRSNSRIRQRAIALRRSCEAGALR